MMRKEESQNTAAPHFLNMTTVISKKFLVIGDEVVCQILGIANPHNSSIYLPIMISKLYNGQNPIPKPQL